MAIEIQVPRLGWSMESGKFLTWCASDGSKVESGEPLFILETDKAAQEVEAFDAGTLHIPANGPQAGEIVNVGQCIGYLLAENELAPPLAASPKRASHQTPSPVPSDPSVRPKTTVASHESKRFSVSPRARRAAKHHGINTSELLPSGAGGRIRERDVIAATTAKEQSTVVRVPLSSLRRSIADRLMLSRQTTVPVTITGRCDATALLELKSHLKLNSTDGAATQPPTLNDIILKLTASALKQHPLLTARWSDEYLLIPKRVHIGFAVDVNEGLLVPVVRDIQQSSLSQITRQTRALIADARAGTLQPSAMQGACFTVSNLGMLGVESFTPIINPPESAILGVGSIVREAVPLSDNAFAAKDRLTLSLTFDHRVIDGAAAARFLQTLRTLVEHPIVGII